VNENAHRAVRGGAPSDSCRRTKLPLHVGAYMSSTCVRLVRKSTSSGTLRLHLVGHLYCAMRVAISGVAKFFEMGLVGAARSRADHVSQQGLSHRILHKATVAGAAKTSLPDISTQEARAPVVVVEYLTQGCILVARSHRDERGNSLFVRGAVAQATRRCSADLANSAPAQKRSSPASDDRSVYID